MVRAPALHQQGRGFESRRLDLSLGCWTYDQCNPSVWGAEVYTRILRPGEDMWKITRMSSEHDPPVPARKPPLLLLLLCADLSSDSSQVNKDTALCLLFAENL